MAASGGRRAGSTGLTLTIHEMEDGAGVPDIKPALAAMGDDVYDYCAQPWTDGATLDAVQQAMDDFTGRWAWDRQVYGHFFTSKMGRVGELAEFGPSRNDPHNTVHGFAPSPSPSWRRAAALTAEAASALRIDPARPLQTLPLLGVLAPDRKEKFTIGQRQTLLYRGIAVEDDVGGQVRINRCITTYQRNAWGQPDPSWLDVTTPATVQYFIRFMRQRILQKFPRHKLADDGTVFGPGQAVVTPRIIKAELVAAYLEMVEAGIVENVDSFQELLIVERDVNDPNRINVLASPDLVNQLRVPRDAGGLPPAIQFNTSRCSSVVGGGEHGLLPERHCRHRLLQGGWRAVCTARHTDNLDRPVRARRFCGPGWGARLH